MLPLNSSCNEQCAVIVFLSAKNRNANLIHSEMQLVYGAKCFTNQTVHVWCEKMLDATSHPSTAWTAASIVLCIRHSEIC